MIVYDNLRRFLLYLYSLLLDYLISVNPVGVYYNFIVGSAWISQLLIIFIYLQLAQINTRIFDAQWPFSFLVLQVVYTDILPIEKIELSALLICGISLCIINMIPLSLIQVTNLFYFANRVLGKKIYFPSSQLCPLGLNKSFFTLSHEYIYLNYLLFQKLCFDFHI